MIRFKLRELLSDMEFKLDKRVTIKDVSESTGINRVTLSKIINQKGYSTTTENVDKLCAFFDCEVHDLMQRVRDELQRAKDKERHIWKETMVRGTNNDMPSEQARVGKRRCGDKSEQSRYATRATESL